MITVALLKNQDDNALFTYQAEVVPGVGERIHISDYRGKEYVRHDWIVGHREWALQFDQNGLVITTAELTVREHNEPI